MSIVTLNTISISGKVNRQKVGLNTEKISLIEEVSGGTSFTYTPYGTRRDIYVVEDDIGIIMNAPPQSVEAVLQLPIVSGTRSVSTTNIVKVTPHVSGDRCTVQAASGSRITTYKVMYDMWEFVSLVNAITTDTSGLLQASNNLSDVSDRQTSLDGLLDVSSGTTNQVLTKDSGGNATWQTPPGATGGEANDGANVGTDGHGVFTGKSGVTLQFRHIAPGSSKVTTSLNADDIDIDIVEGNINHDNLSNFVANEHLNWVNDLGATNIHYGNNTQFDTTNQGVVPGSGGGTANYLRADGTWTAPPGGAGGTPVYVFIKATGQSEGDLHLSDGVSWNIDKALIKEIEIETSSTDWGLYLLQNDNSYSTDDANISARLLNDGGNGNETIYVDQPYEDEDATKEVHLYWIDNSGANTADIIITGYELT